MNITAVTGKFRSRVMSAEPAFRWLVRKDGSRALQQAWRDIETGAVEWWEVETVNEQA